MSKTVGRRSQLYLRGAAPLAIHRRKDSNTRDSPTTAHCSLACTQARYADVVKPALYDPHTVDPQLRRLIRTHMQTGAASNSAS